MVWRVFYWLVPLGFWWLGVDAWAQIGRHTASTSTWVEAILSALLGVVALAAAVAREREFRNARRLGPRSAGPSS